jgi:BirA family biotin operon repressor/biotin-[acetyl-CoA-carboxylase] ligase
MKKIIHLKSCDSTQEVLKEQLSLNPSDDLIISCDHQLKGHGRGDHKWIDTPGTLCFSMSIQAFKIPSFTAMEIAVIIGKFFETKNKNILLKWPNDLINLSGKKCGGILIQSRGNVYLAGIGLNLYYEGKDFGGVYDYSFEIDKEKWAKEISEYIYNHRFEDAESLTPEWIKMCAHLNKEVEISDQDQINRGIFIGLGAFGEAILNTGKELKSIYNGSLKLI